jgi:tetratricopeptide (TPR) repeat protein
MRRAIVVALLGLGACAPRATAAAPHAARFAPGDTSYDEIVRRAERASARARWSEAAELWHRAIASDDRTPAHWWKLGTALFNAGRHRESIAAFERALQLGAGDPQTGAWRIACAYAHRGNRRQALRWLAHAIALGFDGREAIRQEPLFEQYRSDPRFAELSGTSAARRSRGPVPTAGTHTTRARPASGIASAHHADRLVHSTIDPQLSSRPKTEKPEVNSGATAARTNTSIASTSSGCMACRKS